MTLIARLTLNEASIYIGDLLLSRRGHSDDVVDIPAGNDVNANLPAEALRSITRCVQKVNVICDKFLVAWAGDWFIARSIIRNMMEAVKRGARHDEVINVMNAFAEEELRNVAIIGSVISDDPLTEHQFECGAHSFLCGGIEVHAAGSGVDDLRNALSQLILIAPPPTGGTQGDARQWLERMSTALSGSFVCNEMSTGSNILNWWGGAIETACFVGRAYRKNTGVLHAIWTAMRIDDARYDVYFENFLIKYEYFEDVLLTQTFRIMLGESAKTGFTADHSYRAYYPILASSHDYDFEDFVPSGMDHTTLNILVRLVPDVPELGQLSITCYSGNGDTPFRFAKRDGGAQFSFRHDLVENIEGQINEATGLPARVMYHWTS